MQLSFPPSSSAMRHKFQRGTIQKMILGEQSIPPLTRVIRDREFYFANDRQLFFYAVCSTLYHHLALVTVNRKGQCDVKWVFARKDTQ